MPRIIRYYDKTNDYVVDEIVLPEIPLEQLQLLFNVDIENPMYDCFPIDEEKESFFKEYVDVSFLFDNFEYYLEYDS